MSFVKWIKWYYFEVPQCSHIPGEWRMRECGMGKIRHCVKCGVCLDLI